MIRFIYLLIFTLFISPIVAQEVSLDQLEERDNNTYYLKLTGEPYTGACIGKWPNGKKKYEGTFKKGQKDKVWREFDEDELKIFEGNYKKALLMVLAHFIIHTVKLKNKDNIKTTDA